MRAKVSIGISAFFLASLLTLTASAQGNMRVGLGVSVDPFASIAGMGVIGASDVRIPIGVGETVLVEPYAGVSMYSNTIETSDPDTVATEGTSSIRLGTGIFYRIRFTDETKAYVGPQLGVILNGTSEDVEAGDLSANGSTSRTDIHLGLAIGGEHFFDPRFSLGGEISLNYDMYGDMTADVSGDDGLITGYDEDNDITESGSGVYTRAMVLVRWYFMGR